MNLFIHNSLAAKLARGLNGFVAPEHKVVHFRELFAPNTEDATWMAELGTQEHWVIITGNVRIGKNPLEAEAWRVAGHPVFFLKPGWLKLRSWDQAQKFMKCLPVIIETSARAERGASFLVSVDGRIERASLAE